MAPLDGGRIGIAAQAVGIAQGALEEALQIHGGYGHTKEYSVELHPRCAHHRDLRHWTSEIQQMVIAEWIIRPSVTTRDQSLDIDAVLPAAGEVSHGYDPCRYTTG